jgi:hypothetical protein
VVYFPDVLGWWSAATDAMKVASYVYHLSLYMTRKKKK